MRREGATAMVVDRWMGGWSESNGACAGVQGLSGGRIPLGCKIGRFYRSLASPGSPIPGRGQIGSGYPADASRAATEAGFGLTGAT